MPQATVFSTLSAHRQYAYDGKGFIVAARLIQDAIDIPYTDGFCRAQLLQYWPELFGSPANTRDFHQMHSSSATLSTYQRSGDDVVIKHHGLKRWQSAINRGYRHQRQSRFH